MIALPEHSKQVYSLPRECVDELWAVFIEAEKQIKALERDEGDGLDIPSINELRYVAFHLLKSMTTDNTLQELEKAKNHAQRSLFDAHEAQAIDVLSRINKFLEDYRLVNVKAAMPNFIQLQAEVISLKNTIKEFPQGDDRHEKYQKIAEVISRLIQISNEFEASRHILNVQIQEKATTTTRWFIGIGATLVVAVIGMLLRS